jgi:hypothetical protein
MDGCFFIPNDSPLLLAAARLELSGYESPRLQAPSPPRFPEKRTGTKILFYLFSSGIKREGLTKKSKTGAGGPVCTVRATKFSLPIAA